MKKKSFIFGVFLMITMLALSSCGKEEESDLTTGSSSTFTLVGSGT